MSGSRALPLCVVIESSFDPGERLQAPGSLWLLINDDKDVIILLFKGLGGSMS